jgi:hypothetical protein
MPLLDALSVLAIVAPTVLVLFGPATKYLQDNERRWAILYRWAVLVAIVLLLASLGTVPWVAKQ